MEIGRLYRDASRSFAELARTCSKDEWSRPSPCTPGWSCRDLLSHVAGVSIDIVEGNVEGAATAPWTAAQVERWRDVDVGELLERWDATIDQAASAVEFVGESRPPFDCHTHEHDLRTGIGRPGNRDSEIVAIAADSLVERGAARPITIRFDDGTSATMDGDGAPLALDGLSRFELFRSRLGRRSMSQVERFAWSEPPGRAVLDDWFVFGPADVDVVE